MWNIDNIISKQSIKILFQPIISIKKKSVIGYEVLSRGIDNDENIIGAFDLFESARKADKLSALDNLCRLMAIEKYYALKESKYLFINFEISSLNKGESGKNDLIVSLNKFVEKLEALNIEPNKIVIEIIESKVKNLDSLKFFTDLCKSYNLMIALDDVGSGHSNLNRIPLLKPNIIKIDRYLVTDIDKDRYKKEVFKSITSLSRMIGTLVISEGVEKEEEAISSIELRADMIQGYYFSKPVENPVDNIDSQIELLYDRFRDYFVKKTKKNKMFNHMLIKNIRGFSKELELDFSSENIIFNSIKNKINFFLKEHAYVECVYFINSFGKQISPTFFHKDIPDLSDKTLFSPATIDDDHSLKQYFYQLTVSYNNYYITNNYVSMATGNRCKTISTYINDNVILALDINLKAQK